MSDVFAKCPTGLIVDPVRVPAGPKIRGGKNIDKFTTPRGVRGVQKGVQKGAKKGPKRGQKGAKKGVRKGAQNGQKWPKSGDFANYLSTLGETTTPPCGYRDPPLGVGPGPG